MKTICSLVSFLVSIQLVTCRDFYLGMFKKNDYLVAQDNIYKASAPFGYTTVTYGRVFKCPITYFRVVDRLGMGRGPITTIVRGGLRKKFISVRIKTYRVPVSVNIYVGCENKKPAKSTFRTTLTTTHVTTKKTTKPHPSTKSSPAATTKKTTKPHSSTKSSPAAATTLDNSSPITTVSTNDNPTTTESTPDTATGTTTDTITDTTTDTATDTTTDTATDTATDTTTDTATDTTPEPPNVP